ncbi:outer membrane protein OmpK [Photobacterium aphoticum]|uniref:Exported protein n=1 Tax=Photobacterium aphoticum TaxID=754436 RepID=A0A0J1JAN0_9GAMM|nr:outer membrane protein OmpK [Photobacterium aphoticum]KLU98556.1 exported protein precursor [Photobacterium aphoticum]PSU55553.1 hypothetical protein C9I90_15945 [Photobacterium aphoticum]GHA46883.1 hypothetical protein GCM10007086_20820 [Photobacterium aphoticum]
MRKSLVALSVLAAAAALPAQAEYLYGFGNVSVNYLDWSKGTEQRSGGGKDDFVYLELEGGAGFTWGELYGFIDLENVQDGDNQTATTTKGSIAYKLGLGELRAYAQSYSTQAKGFQANNNVLGLSYNFSGDGWFFNPWVGAHHTTTNDFNGMNGGMAGWVAGYNFNAFGQSFMLSNWHETEFARHNDYVTVINDKGVDTNGETDDLSANGAIALWWNVTDAVTTGVQYRYAYNKLGGAGNSNAVIYTVKYNF